ncbi:hypothetical protein TNCV_4557381 [Trichonephila clavipes]|nr:hypothetical protein TNCV_4557381 [Trichonephila clavipes]
MRTMHTTGRTLTHTLSILININGILALCVGRNYPRSFDRAISSVKAPGWPNVSGIPTRGGSNSTAKCSSQHKGSYVVPT